MRLAILVICSAAALGCGTTKWTDTKRAATEQVLLSDAMDRAVSELDFRALAGKTVFLDSMYVKNATDWEYLISTMRQHMLASGCVLRDKKEDADYAVEVRAGAIGTDRHDLLYGVPATDIPSIVPVTGVPRAIPEMPFLKKTEQRGVARIAVFAYNTKTGRPVWQSGVIPVESSAKDLWVLGAGPFQRGTIYDGTRFAGDKLSIPLVDPASGRDRLERFSVTDEAYFAEPVESPPAEEQVAETADPKAAGPQAAQSPPDAKTPPVAKTETKTPEVKTAEVKPDAQTAENKAATPAQSPVSELPATETVGAMKAPLPSDAELPPPALPSTLPPPAGSPSGRTGGSPISAAGYAEAFEDKPQAEKP
ncbi:MAG: DUF6655 family protein [Patescibacteria group bacterium]|nr:DUF6655 family protein [Patescibacteria group bacterium]